MRTTFLALLAAPAVLAAPTPAEAAAVEEKGPAPAVKRELYTDRQGFKFTKEPDQTSGLPCAGWCSSSPGDTCGNYQCSGCSTCAAWGQGKKYCESWCSTKEHCKRQAGVATYKDNAASCNGCNFCGGSLYPGNRKVPEPLCSRKFTDFTDDDCYGYIKELGCNAVLNQVCTATGWLPPAHPGTDFRVEATSKISEHCYKSCALSPAEIEFCSSPTVPTDYALLDTLIKQFGAGSDNEHDTYMAGCQRDLMTVCGDTDPVSQQPLFIPSPSWLSYSQDKTTLNALGAQPCIDKLGAAPGSTGGGGMPGGNPFGGGGYGYGGPGGGYGYGGGGGMPGR